MLFMICVRIPESCGWTRCTKPANASIVLSWETIRLTATTEQGMKCRECGHFLLLWRRWRRWGCKEGRSRKAMGGVWANRLIGDYNWRFLCMPTPPWQYDRPLPPFYGKDDKLSLLIAVVMGVQHALAMASPTQSCLLNFCSFPSLVVFVNRKCRLTLLFFVRNRWEESSLRHYWFPWLVLNRRTKHVLFQTQLHFVVFKHFPEIMLSDASPSLEIEIRDEAPAK